MVTDEQKKYRDRANRARRGLIKEKKDFGFISDGSGKRYRACVYYVLSGSPEKAVEFMDWFESEFPDDIGEPAFFLFAALAYHRVGDVNRARKYLLDTMLSNIYLLPILLSDPISEQDMWHPSNRDQEDYMWEIEEFLNEPTDQEREWIKVQFNSEMFVKLRKKYIDTCRAMKHTSNFEERAKILSEWREYEASIRASEI